jgi:probable HAF family extracellular repeat protein
MKTMAARFFAFLMLGVLALSVLPVAQAQTEYSYLRFDVPNGSQTFPRGINARGDIIGSYVDADGIGHDFLLHNRVYTNIDYPGNAPASARALNAQGDIVGVLDDDADHTHGFLLREGQLTMIDYPGASSTIAFGINNSGDITGRYSTRGGTFGFILSNGMFHNVHIPAGSTSSVYDAEDNGLTLVGDVVLKSDSSIHAFVKRLSQVQLLDPPETVFPCSHARGINQRGEVVGAFSIVNNVDECNSRPPAHGFVMHDGSYDIIDPPGSPDTFAFGINDDGVVVGVVTDKQGNTHGFKATPKH